MGTKFVVIFLAVLMQDALTDSNYYPRFKKISRRNPASIEGESKVLYLLDKPTKRPNKVNIIYIDIPSGSSTTDPPSPDTTPKPHTTPSPSFPQPPHDHYSHFMPFLPPILLPVPGWTGNPPPPFVPPSHPNKPVWAHRPPKPDPHEFEPPIGLSAPGTPTSTTDDEGNWWFNDYDRIQVPKRPGSDLLNNRWKPRPTPSKKPRPSKKPSAITDVDRPLIPESLTEIMANADEDLLEKRKKRRRPSRKPRPSKKPTQVAEKPDNQELEIEESSVEIEKPASLVVTTIATEGDSLANRKKKPRPSRKPSPSKKPTQVIESPGNEGPGSGRPDDGETENQEPINEEPLMLDEIPDEDFTEIEDDLLTNRKKKPRPSKKPKPNKKPEQIVDESISESSPIIYEFPEKDVPQVESDLLTNRKEKPKPTAQITEEADDTESLGPDRDLIVVQRKGKPMKIRRANQNVFEPWKLFKLPIDDDWQRSLHRVRGLNYFILV